MNGNINRRLERLESKRAMGIGEQPKLQGIAVPLPRPHKVEEWLEQSAVMEEIGWDAGIERLQQEYGLPIGSEIVGTTAGQLIELGGQWFGLWDEEKRKVVLYDEPIEAVYGKW